MVFLKVGLKIIFITSTHFENPITVYLICCHGNSLFTVCVPVNSGSHVPAYSIRDDIKIQLMIMNDMN